MIAGLSILLTIVFCLALGIYTGHASVRFILLLMRYRPESAMNSSDAPAHLELPAALHASGD